MRTVNVVYLVNLCEKDNCMAPKLKDKISCFETITVRRYQAPRLKNFFPCSTQLSMKFFQLINVKMPTFVGILTFISRKHSILGLSESKKAEFLDIFLYL